MKEIYGYKAFTKSYGILRSKSGIFNVGMNRYPGTTNHFQNGFYIFRTIEDMLLYYPNVEDHVFYHVIAYIPNNDYENKDKNIFDTNRIVVSHQVASEDIYTSHIESNHKNLEVIPKDLKTFSFYENLIKKDGLLLGNISYDVLEYKKYLLICKLAVNQNAWSFQHVSRKLSNDDYKQLAFTAINEEPLILGLISNFDKNKEMCIRAIYHNPLSIRYSPFEFLDDDSIFYVLERNGILLRYIPICERTYDYCLIALNNTHHAWNYIPNNLLDFDMGLILLDHDPGLLMNIPPKIKGYDKLCVLSIKKNPHNISHINSSISQNNYEKICVEVLETNRLAYIFIPEHRISSKLKKYKK